MRVLGALLLAPLALVACSKENEAAQILAARPPAVSAPERASFPAKCRDALQFDDECERLFDKTFGVGTGRAEKSRLNNKRALGSWDSVKSTVRPAASLGTQ